MNKTLILPFQSHQGYAVQILQTRQVDSTQTRWIRSQVAPIQDLTILGYRRVHLPVSVLALSFELWQPLYFGAFLAAVALLALMVVVLLLSLFLCLFAEPLIMTGLQIEWLQPLSSSSSSSSLARSLFFLMM